MGIVVCISMLLGLCVLQPTPWNSTKRAKQAPKLVLFVAVALLGLGLWNLVYGYLNINGFWKLASIVSGIAMVMASVYVFNERNIMAEDVNNNTDNHSNFSNSALRKAVVAVLALSFLVYAVTLIQLNLGYPILR